MKYMFHTCIIRQALPSEKRLSTAHTPNTEFICIISLYGSITNRQITCNLNVPTSSFQLRTSISPYQFQTLPISAQPFAFRATLQNSQNREKKKIAKNNPISARSTYVHIYICIYHSIVTRERQGLTKYRYEEWSTTMKDCRISRRARLLLLASPSWEPCTPTLALLSSLSAYLRPSNMRISRRKLQLSLKSYATGVV